MDRDTGGILRVPGQDGLALWPSRAHDDFGAFTFACPWQGTLSLAHVLVMSQKLAASLHAIHLQPEARRRAHVLG